MSYYCLKIIHILAATLLVGCFTYSFLLWKSLDAVNHSARLASRIQKQTGLAILPLALIQLITGFSMISLEHYHYSDVWIIGSVIGFVVVIGSWFSFVYFLALSQQLLTESVNPHPSQTALRFFKRIQFLMLSLCGFALLCMIYFMANKSGLSNT